MRMTGSSYSASADDPLSTSSDMTKRLRPDVAVSRQGFVTNDALWLVLLVALQLLLIAVIQPYGNFPLNDDWAYAHSAHWFNTEHRVRLSNWIAMNLLPQTVAGGLVVAAVGFSFDALRHLTQVVAILASIAAFFFFRVASLAPAHAFVATLVVIAMPSWPVLANSYMTDQYSLVFALAASALFLRFLETPSALLLVLATALALIGTLQRQVVIVVPFAFMLASIWAGRGRSARNVTIGAAPFALALVAELLYQWYLRTGPGIPEAQANAHARVWPLLVGALRGEGVLRGFAGLNAVSMAGYLGLFLFGWILWWGMPGASRRWRIACAVLAIVAAVVALACNWLPPYQPDNTIDAAGVGPFSLYGVMTHPVFTPDRSPGIIWPVAGVAAAAGFVALCALALATLAHLSREGLEADRVRLFLAIVVCAYLAPFIVTGYFDRYLLFVLPFLIALWARTWPPSRNETRRVPRSVALTWIMLAMGTGAVATHDYFAWNRARWDAIRHAETLGATADRLDGGFEYNGFYGYETRRPGTSAGKSWWWVRDDEYAVTFSPVPGYQVKRTFAVDCWWSRTPARIYLLHRQHE